MTPEADATLAAAPADLARRQFAERFGGAPHWLVRAPGRVNLIGEHTDYNGGHVLPMAIERAVWIALRPRPDRRVLVRAASMPGCPEAALELDALAHAPHDWIEYIKGVAWAMQDEGLPLRGWEGAVAGDVPIGAGLSSSAALEVAAVWAFMLASDLALEPTRIALLGQKAENGWVGMQCGIMDQLISVAGLEGHAVLIDCRTLRTRPAPLPPGVVVAILDTATRRALESSAYNDRRADCETAARLLGVPYLCDATPEDLAAHASALPPAVLRRARHVITENRRTLDAARALEAGDLAAMGRLMNESHASMRDDFENSTPLMDLMVETALRAPGCYGARMTGGGFGGCAVALLDAGAAPAFAETVARAYAAASGLQPAVYLSRPSPGAGPVP